MTSTPVLGLPSTYVYARGPICLHLLNVAGEGSALIAESTVVHRVVIVDGPWNARFK